MQRSLSGGFLTEDAKLLNANARSMFDEAGHNALGGAPLTRARYGAGRLYAANIGSPRSRL